MIRATCLALALGLAACSPPEEPAPPPAPPPAETAAAPPPATTPNEATAEDTCNQAQFAHLIGQFAADIDQDSLPERTRIITPNTMVTQDFVPARLNIMVGADGRVGSLRCY